MQTGQHMNMTKQEAVTPVLWTLPCQRRPPPPPPPTRLVLALGYVPTWSSALLTWLPIFRVLWGVCTVPCHMPWLSTCGTTMARCVRPRVHTPALVP